MTGPIPGGSVPPDAAPAAARKVLVAATSAFLFVAPLSGTAGLRATTLGLVALAAAFAAWRGAFRGLPAFPRGVLVAFVAWAALAIASLAWSENRGLTLGELRGEVAYGALAFFGFYYASLDLARLRLWAAALGLGCVFVMAMQGVQSAWPFWPNRLDGGGGYWSTHLVLVAPMLFVLAWPRPWGLELGTPALVVAFALVLLAGWIGENRMLWVALTVQLAICAAFANRMPPMPASRARTIRRFMVATAVVLAAAAAATVAERNERLFANSPMITHLERDLRPAIWRKALEVIGEAPVLGHGFGREIRAASFLPVNPPKSAGEPDVRHAHNVFLDAAVQLGLVGAAAFTALMAALALSHARLLASPRAAPLGLIGLALLAGFLTKNFTDDFFHRHNAQVFWALNGALLGLGRRLQAPP